MSLIDEALKRARQEAARQDAAEREARYARVPVYAPLVTSRKSSRSWLIPVMVALCIAVGVGVGVLLTRDLTPDPSPITPPRPSAGPIGRGAPPPAPKTSFPPLPVGRGAMGEGGQGGEVRAAPETVSETVEPQPSRIEIVEETPAPAPAPAEEAPPAAVPATPDPLPYPNVPAAPREEPAAPSIQLPQTPQAEPKTYVREVPVPGGGSIRLNGIAYSEQPVALFSDKVVGVGESIGGYTVVAIEQKRVQLQGQGETVYVTLQ